MWFIDFCVLMIPAVDNVSEVPSGISPTDARHSMNQNIPFQQVASTLYDREETHGEEHGKKK
jgi:hypothetical protein